MENFPFFLISCCQFSEAKDDDEVDRDGCHANKNEDDDWSSDIMSDSSDDLHSKTRNTVKKKVFHKNKTRNVNKIGHKLENTNNTLNDSRDHKVVSINKKRKQVVTFKSPGSYENDIKVTKKGKVNPVDSKTGKGPVKKGRRDRDDRNDNSFRVDQTLAGSFADVGDVFGK